LKKTKKKSPKKILNIEGVKTSIGPEEEGEENGESGILEENIKNCVQDDQSIDLNQTQS
jgi:hypothetical protein